jgi:hypothetical protein
VKSFRKKDEQKRPPPDDSKNPAVDFRGEKRGNAKHESTTDPEALLARKGSGQPAKLSYAQHAPMENKNGLIVDVLVTKATGTAERDAALQKRHAPPGDGAASEAGDRRAHDETPRLRAEPAHPQTLRGDLRLDQDGGEAPGPRVAGWPRGDRDPRESRPVYFMELTLAGGLVAAIRDFRYVP